MRRYNKGFTLTELTVALVVGLMLMLVIGMISSIGYRTDVNVRREAELYNDIFFGFDLIQRRVREAQAVSATANTLSVDNLVFQSDGSNFFYADTDDDTDHMILENGNGITFSPTVNDELVTVRLQGIKQGFTFDLSAEAMRRN